MKKIILFIIITFVTFVSIAQNVFPVTGSVGIGTTTPSASALVDMSSTTKGLLIPRLTKAQRQSIISPAAGLMVYQTNSTPGLYVYNSSGGWKPLVTTIGADRNLSNLTAPAAVNVSLLPKVDSSYDLGGGGQSWRDIYFDGGIFYDYARFIGKVGSNTYVGWFSGAEGEQNVTLGEAALFNNTGEGNAAVGYQSLTQNITGHHNTATGTNALYFNSSGFYNSATGYEALYNNDTGNYNTANGVYTLQNNVNGYNNTAIGYLAIKNNTSGYDNTAIGVRAGLNVTSYRNTAIGSNAGTSNTKYSTFLGVYANGKGGISNAVALGYKTQVNTSNSIVIGNSSIVSIQGQVGFTTISDGRFKKNINDNVPGLAFIRELKPITYTLDAEGIESKLHTNDPDVDKDDKSIAEDKKALDAKSKIIYTGLIAQDVQAAAKKINYEFSGVDAPKDENDLYGLRYAEFVMPLVKAVQELDSSNKALKNEIEKLQQAVDSLSKNQIIGFVPGNNTLGQNRPNPFYGNTIINYNIAQATNAALVITQTGSGKTVKSVALSPGSKQILLNTNNLATGVYTYSLVVDGKVTDSKQMVVKP